MKAKDILIEAKLSRKYWGKIIIKAEKEGSFDNKGLAEASKWATCACGRQDKRIPRRPDYLFVEPRAPKDKQLFNLGASFMYAVNNNKFTLAAKRLIRIENRAAKILAKLNNQSALPE